MPFIFSFRKAYGRIARVLGYAFFIFPLAGSGQFTFDANCLNAYRSVLSLKFAEAKEFLGEERRADPSNLVPVYLEDYMDFLTVFIGQEKEAFERYRGSHEKRVDAVKAGSADSPYYGFCLGTMRLQFAVARMQFGESRSAVFDLSKAYRDFQSAEYAYPRFLPVKTGLGFVHILAGLAGDSYGWLLRLAGFSGTVEEGMQEITGVADYRGPDELEGIPGTEALFFLSMASAFLGSDKTLSAEVIKRFENRPGPFPPAGNPLVIFAESTVYLKNGMNDAALATLKEYVYRPGEFPFYYLDFLTGKALLNKLDPGADRYFIRFLKNFRGINYIRSAYQKLAWTCLLAGDTVKYREYTKKILTRGGSLFDTDVQALREAESDFIPNVVLLKARLLSDGGYYDRALDLLLGNRLSSFVAGQKDLVEYHYRLGRIYQGLGSDDHALRCFGETIRLGKGLPWYFAANAALQSGLIEEQRGAFREAEQYYSMVLSMNYSEYKTGLDQKARAGLKRVKKHLG